jgi:DNA-binding CsgD family transcriptional regulator
MLRLGRRDLRAVLDCLRMTYAALDLEAFPRQVIAGLRRVVRAPFGSYNEIDHRAARIRYVVEPAAAQVPHLEMVVRQYLHEQPVVAHYRRTGDGSPHKLSDFLTRQEFHRLGIYNENYRRTGVEYQMTFMVQSLQRPSPTTIAIALDRGPDDCDFSERDRFMLSLVRPHLMTAYANAETMSAFRRRAPAASGAPETRPREIIVLRQTGRHLISPRAARWLAQYFNDGSPRNGRLPDDLECWIRRQALPLRLGNSLPFPATPLIVDRQDTRLSIRLIPDSPDHLLVLEEEKTAVDYVGLQRLGLTPREAEVLHWVSEGKTNFEIGAILHSSPRTVGKHLERIYAKLDVETRTAAAAAPRLAAVAHFLPYV